MPKLPLALALILAVSSSAPAGATGLGTPMDCTDLILAPGLSCSQISNPGEGGSFRTENAVVDNDGRIMEHGDGSIRDVIAQIGDCGTSPLHHLGLVFHIGLAGARTPIVSVQQRCLDVFGREIEGVRSASLLFDGVGGALLVTFNSTCNGRFGSSCASYPGGSWIARIDGFTPLADALPEPLLPEPLCNNGLDDDGDGAVDLDDRHCKSAADNDESRP